MSSPSVIALPAPPKGYAAWVSAYGDITPYIKVEASGQRSLSPDWWNEKIVRVELPFSLRLSWARAKTISYIWIHKYAAPAFEQAFLRLHEERLSVYVYEFGGTFNFRSKRGSDKLSTHAYPAAIDLNPETNALGTPGDMNREVVQVFEDLGFTYGGRWLRKDPMHFQFGEEYG